MNRLAVSIHLTDAVCFGFPLFPTTVLCHTQTGFMCSVARVPRALAVPLASRHTSY